MIRSRLLAVFLVVFVTLYAFAQATPQQTDIVTTPTQQLAPHLFTFYGTFERTPEGWLCKHAAASGPALLRDLHIGDVLVSIDGEDLTHASPLGLLQFLRLAEFNVAESAEIIRTRQRVTWAAAEMPPAIIASQNSFEVLHSSYATVHKGDVLTALNQATFAAMMATVTNPLTSVVNVGAHPGKVLHFTRGGRPATVTIDRPTMVRLINFDLDPAQQPPSGELLQSLNGKNAELSSMRARWTLLHFWASWCAPCMRHMPDIEELSQRKDLTVAAIGYADTNERLEAAAAKRVNVFAPNLALQRQLAITGIPFDALLDPNGNAVLIIAGDMPGNEFRKIVAGYVTTR